MLYVLDCKSCLKNYILHNKDIEEVVLEVVKAQHIVMLQDYLPKFDYNLRLL